MLLMNPVVNAGEGVDFRGIIARFQQDREHAKPRKGHDLTEECEERCGIACQRAACSCGWKGEWRKRA